MTRFTALIGLRGCAALLVVLDHCSLLITPVAVGVRSHPDPSSGLGAAIAASPLNPWAIGTAAVFVFFTLSGFVLACGPLTAPRLRDYRWEAFFPRRLIRLWLPAIASVGLGALVMTVLPASGEAEAWLARQGDPDLSIGGLLDGVGLPWVDGRPDVNPPLWTLKWEIIGSVLLPLMLVAARTCARVPWLPEVLAGLAAAIGAVLVKDSLIYLPPMFLGAAIAIRHRRLRADPPSPRARRTEAAVGGVGLFASAWAGQSTVDSVVAVGTFGEVAFAGMVIAATLPGGAFERFFDGRGFRWLGDQSFSLYLVHLPIVIGVGYLLLDHPLLAIAIALPASFAVAFVVNRWIELPSHRLAVATGRWVSELVRRRAPVRAPR